MWTWPSPVCLQCVCGCRWLQIHLTRSPPIPSDMGHSLLTSTIRNVLVLNSQLFFPTCATSSSSKREIVSQWFRQS